MSHYIFVDQQESEYYI